MRITQFRRLPDLRRYGERSKSGMKIFVLLLSAFFSPVLSIKAGESLVYFGTYTRGAESKGIYVSNFNDETGGLSDPVLAVAADNPSFLTLAPSGQTLYAVSEISGEGGAGLVSAYRVLDGGKLELINQQSSGGAGPCYVSVSPNGKVLALANYGGGSVASYRITDTGALSEAASFIQHTGSSVNAKRQAGPHAHSINFSSDSRFAYAADLGVDRVFIYSVDPSTGKLALAGETKVDPGSGPRHFSFRPDGKFAYLINEMTLKMTVFAVDRDSGALTAIQSLSTLPDGAEAEGSTAEVVCHPSGKFLYGSNRGHDSIVVYAIDAETGKLEYLENESIRGKTPRNFVVSPCGKWLLAAGQQSGNVTVFAVDQETGELTFSGTEIKVAAPVCIRFRVKKRRNILI